MQPNQFPSGRTNTVFLRALLTNTGSLHPSITKVVLRTRASTLATLYFNQGQPFEPAIKHSDSSYTDPAKFAKVLKQVKAETKFEAIKQIITPVYVGRTDGLKSLTYQILGIQQSYYDQQTRQRRFGTVTEMSQKMQALLQEIDQSDPPDDLPDLEQMFFQGLHDNIKLKIINGLNAGVPANLGQNLHRYNDIVKHAMAVEEDQKRVAKQIQQITRNMMPAGHPNTRGQGRGGPRVFLATHQEDDPKQRGCAFTTTAEDTQSGSKDSTWTNTPMGTRYSIPLTFCAKYTGNTIAEDMVAASVEMVEILAEEETPDLAFT
jgi:hypothetical protein